MAIGFIGLGSFGVSHVLNTDKSPEIVYQEKISYVTVSDDNLQREFQKLSQDKNRQIAELEKNILALKAENDSLKNKTSATSNNVIDKNTKLEDIIKNEQLPVFNGHHYKLFDEYISWGEAKLKCKALGGHLVTIQSEEENNFIYDLIEKSGKRRYDVWIGAFYKARGGKRVPITELEWEWVTGEVFNFTKFRDGFFNSHKGLNYHVCIRDNRWVDWSGSGDGYYICEWDF